MQMITSMRRHDWLFLERLKWLLPAELKREASTEERLRILRRNVVALLVLLAIACAGFGYILRQQQEHVWEISNKIVWHLEWDHNEWIFAPDTSVVLVSQVTRKKSLESPKMKRTGRRTAGTPKRS